MLSSEIKGSEGSEGSQYIKARLLKQVVNLTNKTGAHHRKHE